MFLASRTPELQPSATRIFFAGDTSSIDDIQTMLEVLPICARGQVFIEVADAGEIVPVTAPGRVSITWLDRSRRSGRPGTGERCLPGVALDRAVRAWIGEFFVERADLVDSDYVFWLGGPTSFAYDLRHDLGELFDAAPAL
ncbi:siderophore-interacting protein [Frondihabitans sp. PhB188]|uniref:SIP domain-containing protein n=1 Tax=Frondihabitans sp. PhB188 TaxID=2485200 RepID=UPI000F4908E6|nr:SIP domain-containing protein [Frondihabitans sp. PhB188]ROQ41328.1 siderophore-interacting protein [Frondihabitans sp. PhB188]